MVARFLHQYLIVISVCSFHHATVRMSVRMSESACVASVHLACLMTIMSLTLALSN